MNFKNQIPHPVRKLAEHFEFRVAGGAVRDLLMGLSPKDWDLATPVLPKDVVRISTAAGFNVIPTGLKHGTVTVVVDGMPLEVTTLRIDRNTDGRHAEVDFTTDWRTDSSRRDFTINSMFLTMDGEVIDFFDGVYDVKARHVRFVGDPDARMQEDYLRLLRAYRFCGRLGSESCPEHFLYSVRRNAHGLKQISGERVWNEMRLILGSDIPHTLISAMKDAGVLPNIGLSDQTHTLNLYDVAKLTENPITRLVAVTPNWNPSAKYPTLLETLKDQWHVSSDEYKLAEFLVKTKDTTIGTMEDLKEMVLLHNVRKDWVKELAALLHREEELEELDKWHPPVFPLTGKDLIGLGVAPGPRMGDILARLKRDWVSNLCMPPREELLVWAQKEYIDKETT